MKIVLVTISPRRSGLSGATADLVEEYVLRGGRYVSVEHRSLATEALMFSSLQEGRTRPMVLLTDSRGVQVSSEELSAMVGRAQDDGVQTVVVGVGPADGWSQSALAQAAKVIAFGRITLPHELAAVVAAEQIYRALTIRAGHPYHSGH